MGGNKELRDYRRQKRKQREKNFRESSGYAPMYDPHSLGVAGPAGRTIGTIVRGIGRGISYGWRGLGALFGEGVEQLTGTDTYSLEEFRRYNRRNR